MLGFSFDGIYARHIENRILAHLPYFFGRSFRHNAKLRHGVRRMGLDFKPNAKARLRLPDIGHFGS